MSCLKKSTKTSGIIPHWWTGELTEQAQLTVYAILHLYEFFWSTCKLAQCLYHIICIYSTETFTVYYNECVNSHGACGEGFIKASSFQRGHLWVGTTCIKADLQWYSWRVAEYEITNSVYARHVFYRRNCIARRVPGRWWMYLKYFPHPIIPIMIKLFYLSGCTSALVRNFSVDPEISAFDCTVLNFMIYTTVIDTPSVELYICYMSCLNWAVSRPTLITTCQYSS